MVKTVTIGKAQCVRLVLMSMKDNLASLLLNFQIFCSVQISFN